MLKHPDTQIDFVVDLSYFVACFDVFDREEDFGVYLERFDPNNENDLRTLFLERLTAGKIVEKYTASHKYAVAHFLEQSLLDPTTDFAVQLSRARLEETGLCLPLTWCIHDARKFFFIAYRCVFDEWNENLKTAGYTLTPPSMLPA